LPELSSASEEAGKDPSSFGDVLSPACELAVRSGRLVLGFDRLEAASISLPFSIIERNLAG
jgi:hypothetical protein